MVNDLPRPPWPAQAAATLHPLLIVVLVALRPLIWGGDWGDPVQLAWQALVLVGCAAVLVEHACGARRTWRWGPAGIAAAVALAIALPAAIRSPLRAEGQALWGMWAMHALFAAWLAQAAGGRERLLAGALVAGLVGEAMTTLGQWTWALPAIAARMQPGGGELLYEGRYADLVERALNGGAFGTFTHANALGAYLLLTIPVAIGVALRRDERGLHLAAGAIALIGVAALSLTDSKGAWLAAAATVAIAALAALRGRWRAGVIAALVVGAALTLAWPRAREALVASAAARVDYWRGAAALIGERPLVGHGIGGFGAHYPRVMPLDAEPARSAHSQPLEAAVAGGVALAAALIALAVCLVRGRAARALGASPTTDAWHATAFERWSPLVPFVAVPYAQIAGLIDFSDWPGGAAAPGEMAWACAIGGLMSVACAAVRGVAAPHASAARLALAALCLHLLIDDDLHHPGIVGTLAAVACLAGVQRARIASPRARIAAAMALIAIMAVWIFAAGRARELGQARALVDDARLAQAMLGQVVRDPPPIGRRLAARLDRSPETPLSELVEIARVQALKLCRRWPRADSDLELAALARFPAGGQRLPLSREAAAAHPHSAHARMLVADDLVELGRWDEATAPLIEAVGLAPTFLPYRQMLAATLREAARRLPSRADELEGLAHEAEDQARALETVVHPRNRAP